MIQKRLTLRLSGFFRGQMWTSLVLTADDLEAAHDAIAHYVAFGLALEQVKVRQEDGYASWPADLFDSIPLQARTQTLRREWEDLLMPLLPYEQAPPRQLAQLSGQLSFYQRLIEQITVRATRLEKAYQRALLYQDAELRQWHTKRLQARLDEQERQLTQLQGASKRLEDYLAARQVWKTGNLEEV